MSGISALFRRGAAALALIACASTAHAGICRATPQGDAGNTGNDWNAPVTLQGALQTPACTEIWVARGVYYPVAPADPSAPTPEETRVSFAVRPGVRLLGGFAGTETALDQRTITTMAANPSVLSGDIDHDDCGPGAAGSGNPGHGCPGGINTSWGQIGYGETGNSLHIVTLDGGTALGPVSGDTLIEGFTITAGNGRYNQEDDNEITALKGNGTGLLCRAVVAGSACSPTLRHLDFSGNWVRTAAVVDIGGSGALFYAANGGEAKPSLENITFRGNRGGAGLSPTLATYAVDANSRATLSLSNSTFSDNTGAVAIRVVPGQDNDWTTLTHVTIAGQNNAAFTVFLGTAPARIVNSVLWNPQVTSTELYAASTTVTNSVVRGSGGSAAWNLDAIDGGGNLDVDPRFARIGYYGGPTPTHALQRGSPAIDAGNDAACLATDQRGRPRPQGGHCDIGAYEADSTPRTCHVAADATGASDGTSWADAYADLQLALADPGCSEIWVARGVYYPIAPADPAATTPEETRISFAVTPGVKLRGGFAGTETLLEQRTPSTMAANPSVLSGDIDHDDCGGTGCPGGINTSWNQADLNETGNSLHVVKLDGGNDLGPVTNDTLIEGFTITAGFGRYTLEDPGEVNALKGSGPGLLCRAVTPGSACSPTLRDIDFSGNWVRLPYSNNIGGSGALFYAINGSEVAPVLENSTFRGNSATGSLAATLAVSAYDTSSNAALTLSNSTLSENNGPVAVGVYQGSAISTDAILSHVTITDQNGGSFGAFLSGPVSGQIVNSLLWIDAATNLYAGSASTVSNSLVRGSGGSGASWTLNAIDGGGNLDADPLLGVLADNGGPTPTQLPDAASPLLDAANDTACPAFDQRGMARPQGAHCDIGAVELRTRYNVGGSILNLTHAGLALQLDTADGSEDLPIAAGGHEFRFEAELSPGTNYSVSIATQPAAQYCMVSNGEGTMPADDVIDVRVDCIDVDPIFSDGFDNVATTSG